MMDNRKHHHGSLIAFEGPENLISTQLRLLPSSPQLLILPSLQHYMKGPPRDSDVRFNSRSYIKDIHSAALARREAALRFLDESTNNNKRLVFLNGGTAGAVSQCISAISEHQTSGDAILAEAIFRNIASEGVKGLDQEEKYANQQALDILSSDRGKDEVLCEGDQEDPITRAMRAADALYNKTDSLQPVDCYIRTRPRSLSLPMLDYVSGLGQASPFFVFGSSPSEDGGSVFDDDDEGEGAVTGEETDEHGVRALKNSQGGPKLRISVPPRPGNSIIETMRTRSTENRSTVHLLSSPTPDSFMSPPLTPEGVVYGEARVVQMAASKSQKKLRRVRSLDDMELNEARRRRISAQLELITKRAAPIDSPSEPKSRHLSIVDDPYSPNNLLHLGQAKFVKAQTTTIRRSPTFSKGASPPPPLRETYVNHGTDAAEIGDELHNSETEFEPVLPLHEDLVIPFTSFGRDYIMDSVIQSFMDGSYPILTNTSDSSHTAETDSCPSTPRTADLFDLDSRVEGLSPVAEVPSADEASDYDPYAARGSDVRLASKMVHQRSTANQQESQQLPTPAQSPTPHVDAKFHTFSTAGHSTAIATQNALRAVLEGYYPQQEGTGYFQFNSSLLPDVDKLWRPVFRVSETQGGKASQPTTDLMLAIGCQNGVNSEVIATLTGQVEKLGSRSNGMSRSGRLDIRYLIATAMQSFSTQHLTSLAASTLTDSPYALACLLIPHLETYLATNTATRFLLLSYPADHLATVISLQKLIGADAFKVVGILDTSDTTPYASRSTTRSSSPSIGSIEQLLDASTPGISSPPTTQSPLTNTTPTATEPFRPTIRQRRRMSFSRADYVLASSATDAETTHLLATIRKLLINIDAAFYTPEALPRKPALVSKFTGAPVTIAPASPPLSPPYNTSGSSSSPRTPRNLAAINFPYAPPPPPPPPSERAESPARWLARSRSRERGRQGQGHIAAAATRPLSLKRNGSSPGDGGDARSAYAVSVVGEDEFYDAEERRLMPMYMRQNEIRKGNSRKALKWLGLA